MRRESLPSQLAAFAVLSLFAPLVACGDDDVGEPTVDSDTEAETNGDRTTEDGSTSDGSQDDGESGGGSHGGTDAGDEDTTATAGETGLGECEGVSYDECDDVEGCLWLGTEDTGICVNEDGGGIELCASLSMQQCELAPGCAWDDDLGVCEALGCEGLAQGQCTLAPDCNWNPTDMVCEDA
jgi:hypothetical protein